MQIFPSTLPLLLLLVPPQTPATPPPAEDDPAVLHLRMLAAMDAQIDAQATRAHLDARQLLEQLMPVPYLGVDATPKDGGMHVDHVYVDSGAEAAGLREGDLLLRMDSLVLDSKTSLARAVRAHRSGQQVELALRRDGQELKLAATIGHRPAEDEDEDEQFPDLPLAPMTKTALGFDFESGGSALPAALESLLGGRGRMGDWQVLAEGSRHFVRQADDDRTGSRFPMLIAKDFDAANVVARVRFRYSGGKADRAAGVVLHYQDPGNYLVARANQAEADLRIFRTVNGLRTTLPGAAVPAPTNDTQWHTLEFRCEGPKLSATLDGKVTATSYDTYFRRGRVGLWTKSDSITDFDELSFEPLELPR
ncbi:MAG: PDZ domain-containing protein [Planctomycetes bacterium]|nr:PDZ domain-containing protein [Planctomycetota bacterium]